MAEAPQAKRRRTNPLVCDFSAPGGDVIIKIGRYRFSCVRATIERKSPVLGSILNNRHFKESLSQEPDFTFDAQDYMRFILLCIHGQYDHALSIQNCKTINFLYNLVQRCAVYHCAQIVPSVLESCLKLPGDVGVHLYKSWEKEFFIAFSFNWVKSVTRIYPYVISKLKILPITEDEAKDAAGSSGQDPPEDLDLTFTTPSEAGGKRLAELKTLESGLVYHYTPISELEGIPSMILADLWYSRIEVLQSFAKALSTRHKELKAEITSAPERKGSCADHKDCRCMFERLGSFTGHLMLLDICPVTITPESFSANFDDDILALAARLDNTQPPAQTYAKNSKKQEASAQEGAL